MCLGRRQATGVAGTLGGRPGDSICLCCCPSARRAVDDQLCVGRAARPSRRLDGRGKAADPSAVPGGRPVSHAGRPLRGGFARQVGRGRCGAPSRDSSPPHPFPSGDAWPPHGGPSRGLFRWLPRPLRRGGRAPPRGVPSPRPGESGTTSASPAPPRHHLSHRRSVMVGARPLRRLLPRSGERTPPTCATGMAPAEVAVVWVWRGWCHFGWLDSGSRAARFCCHGSEWGVHRRAALARWGRGGPGVGGCGAGGERRMEGGSCRGVGFSCRGSHGEGGWEMTGGGGRAWAARHPLARSERARCTIFLLGSVRDVRGVRRVGGLYGREPGNSTRGRPSRCTGRPSAWWCTVRDGRLLSAALSFCCCRHCLCAMGWYRPLWVALDHRGVGTQYPGRPGRGAKHDDNRPPPFDTVGTVEKAQCARNVRTSDTVG